MFSCFKTKPEEIERPSQSDSGQGYKYLPNQTIYSKKMPTQGTFINNYPQAIIVHYTSGRYKSRQDAINTIEFGISQNYAYWMITREGELIQTHELDKWGYHAGVSSYTGFSGSLSRYSLGLEIACAGTLTEKANGFYTWWGDKVDSSEVRLVYNKDNVKAGAYHVYSKEQEESLMNTILQIYKNKPKGLELPIVLGHDEVAPKRKSDPGGSLSMTMPEFRSALALKWKELQS